MSNPVSIGEQVTAILKRCRRVAGNLARYERALDELHLLGPGAIPFLIDEADNPDWDRATTAACALSRFGMLAADAIPMLFERRLEAVQRQEDGFELAADYALMAMAPARLEYFRDRLGSDDITAAWSALWILGSKLPHNRRTFEFLTERLLEWRLGEPGIILPFLAQYPEFGDEAGALVLRALEKDQWMAALTLAELRQQGAITDEIWQIAFIDASPELQLDLGRAEIQAEINANLARSRGQLP